ncbi:MAG: hypothetical protein RBT72_06175 [Spirochaetia bacterium]|nr:hypothetical protein [Spirochaetia bacterium]
MAGQMGYPKIYSFVGTAQVNHKAASVYPEIIALIGRHANPVGIVLDAVQFKTATFDPVFFIHRGFVD